MADERDEIRARINIVDLVGQTVLLRKAGKTWKGLCPFHADKNPSFTVDPTFGSYRCWSCQEHGDVFTWVMKTRHVEFPEALQMLAEMAGVSLTSRTPTATKSDKARWSAAMADALAFFREQLAKSESALSYCERRGISEEARLQWEIGYAPDVGDALASFLKRKGHSLPECKELFLVDEDSTGGYYDKFRGRLVFPIRNEAGDLVAFGGRLLGDGHPKYINSGDTPLYRKSRVLYGMHRAKETLAKEKRAVLVEGYLDVVACHAAGVTGAVASLGTALAEEHARLLKRWCDEVVILYDSDAAGQKAADRAVAILQGESLRTRIALMPAGEDPDTLLRTAGALAVQQAVETGLDPLDYRIKKLLASRKPEEDEFWLEAVEILAGARTDMHLDRYLVELAAMSPGVTDPRSAQQALRRQVARYKREAKTARPDGPAPRPINPFRSLDRLKSAEVAVFRGLLEPGLKQLAWSACGQLDLMITPAGREVAEAIRQAFPDGPPQGQPSVWVNRIEPDSVRETFMVAQYDPRADQLSEAFLEDAIAELHRNQENRELSQLKRKDRSDQSLLEITERLRKLKVKDE